MTGPHSWSWPDPRPGHAHSETTAGGTVVAGEPVSWIRIVVAFVVAVVLDGVCSVLELIGGFSSPATCEVAATAYPWVKVVGGALVLIALVVPLLVCPPRPTWVRHLAPVIGVAGPLCFEWFLITNAQRGLCF